MKVGDLVKFESNLARRVETYGKRLDQNPQVGVIIAESPYDSLLADAFVVLWQSGEIVERVSPGILEVVNESR